MLNEYNWIGFSGYVFVFLFFFFAEIALIIGIIYNINTAKEYGLNFQYPNSKDMFLRTPLRSLIIYSIGLIANTYFFLYKLAFYTIPFYWEHLK